LANPAKASHKLGWRPMLSFVQLVHLMVDEDMAALAGKTSEFTLQAA
jgi:GDP-D-mannose dehydratase